MERPVERTIGTLAALVLAATLVACADDNDGRVPNLDTPDSPSMQGCPDRLEVYGPYVSGVDPQYDPSMDWDGDGVSCES